MPKPEPKKFAIINLGHEFKITIENPNSLTQAKTEAEQFGGIRENDRNSFYLQYRPTFNKNELLDYLNEKFEEIL